MKRAGTRHMGFGGQSINKNQVLAKAVRSVAVGCHGMRPIEALESRVLLSRAAVEDRAWMDFNGNGIQDAGEARLDGVQVRLFDLQGLVASTRTAQGGSYRFEGLEPDDWYYPDDSYYLGFIAPAGFQPSPQDRGPRDGQDRDASPADGQTAPVPAISSRWSSPALPLNVSAERTTLVGNRVWNDADGDGVQDANEGGLGGITVRLLSDGGDVLATVNTSDDGSYRFENLQPNQSCRLEFVVPVEWTLSPRDQGSDDVLDSDVDLATARTDLFVLVPGQVDLNLDAGLMRVASVRGRCFNDLDEDGQRDFGDPGLADRTVYVDANGNSQWDEGEASTRTDADGNYRLDNLYPGTWRIGLIPQSHWKQTAPADGFHTLALKPADVLENIDLGSASLLPKVNAYPIGSESLVSQPGHWSGYYSFEPAVAMNAAGDYVAVWQVYYYPDHDTCGVYAQQFSAAGTPQGEIICVANSLDDRPMMPAVAIDDAGNFVVAWQEQWRVAARIYNAAGAPQGGGFTLGDTEAMPNAQHPAVAMDADGDFVIAWQSARQGITDCDIYAQRFDLDGAPQGEMITVAAGLDRDQVNPAVAMDLVGNFVIAWQDQEVPERGEYCLYARRYDAAGQALADPFRVTPLNTDYQTNPAVAIDKHGRFVIAWQGYWSEEPKAGDIYAQWFDAAGQAQGPTRRVSTTPGVNDTVPAVALSGDGNCVIAWQVADESTRTCDVVMRTYDAAGVPLDYERRVHANAMGQQVFPAVAADAGGDFVVLWETGTFASDTLAGDGSYDPWLSQEGEHEIRAQRFWWVADAVQINGLAWKDVNANGGRDLDEPLLAGITVNLLNESGDVLASAVTDGNGGYAFPVVRPDATYSIQMVAPSGLLFTRNDGEFAEEADSDLDPATGRSAQFVLKPGHASHRIDAGLIEEAILTGFVFNDVDTSGRQDSGDCGLPNWIVYIDQDADGQRDPGEPFAVTADDGSYTIAGLRPGVYRVTEELQDHWKPTLPSTLQHTMTLAVGQIASGLNFGNHTTVPSATHTLTNGEFRVNVATHLDESVVDIAMNAKGEFVVTFMRVNHRTLEYGIYGRRYSASGQSLGGEIQIVSPDRYQSGGSVVMDASGGFVVTWTASASGVGEDVYMRRFSASGVAQGEPVRINAYTIGDQRERCIRMDQAGNFTVFWQDWGAPDDKSHAGVYARRFDASGQALGDEFRLTTPFGNVPEAKSIAMDSDGDFIVAYSNWRPEERPVGIYLQRYNVAGTPRGNEIFVGASSSRPSVALADSGEFAVAWDSLAAGADGLEIYAQRYNAAGVPQGAAFHVNSHTDEFQEGPVARMGADASLLIVWTSADQDGSGLGVYGQRYNAAGLPQGGEFRVNRHTDNNQRSPVMAMDADGDFVVAWSSNQQDGTEHGVYAQRYTVARTEPFAEIATVTPDPRSETVTQLQIVFNEPVTGFDLADLWFSRDGGPNLLTSDQTLTSVDGRTWTLANLDLLTFLPGQYTLALAAEGSGIIGRSGQALTIGAAERFTVTAVTIPGTPGNDHFELHYGTDSIQIVVSSGSAQKKYTVPIAGIMGIDLAGAGGDDSFFVDFSVAVPLSSQRFLRVHGGDQGDRFDSADRLTIQCGSIAGHYHPSGAVYGSGDLNLGCWLVQFTGIESLAAASDSGFTVATPNPDDSITINTDEHDRNWVSGSSGAVPFVPIILSGRSPLTLDLAANDGLAGNDTVHLPTGLAEDTRLRVLGGNGDNSVTIDGGTVELMPAASGNFALTVKGSAEAVLGPDSGITTLAIQDQARIKVKSDLASVLRLKGLSIGGEGTLDLSGNDLIVQAPAATEAALFQISTLVGSGRNAGPNRWEGTGITSSTLVGLPLKGLAVTIDGEAVLVKHTWNGDVNRDGVVDAADYFLVDSGYITQQGGYRHGDLNYDGTVDAADYFLIDSAYIGQMLNA